MHVASKYNRIKSMTVLLEHQAGRCYLNIRQVYAVMKQVCVYGAPGSYVLIEHQAGVCYWSTRQVPYAILEHQILYVILEHQAGM